MDMNMETNQISATISAKEDETLTFDELTEMADEVVEKALTIDGIETIGAMAGGSSFHDGRKFYRQYFHVYDSG